MSAAYSGSLTAVFAAPAYEKPIDTLEDAVSARAVAQWPLHSSIDELILVSKYIFVTSTVNAC